MKNALKSRGAFEFGRSEIELIFRIKIRLKTYLNN